MSASTTSSPIAAAGQMFLDSLDEKNRSIVTICASADTFIRHVEQLEEFQKANTGTRKRLFDSITVFTDNVGPYLKVVDTLVSSKPEVGALVWGAAKLVLLAANNYSNFFRKLTNMLESISSNFAVYKSLVQMIEEYGIDLTTGLRCAIVTTYSGILEFFQKIVQVFYRKTGESKHQSRVVANLLWKPFDSTFNTLQEKLSSCDALVDKELQLFQLKLLLKGQQNDKASETHNENQLSEEVLENIKAIQALMESVKKVGEKRHIDDVRRDIRQWINPPEFMRKYEFATDEMEDNTGDWIYQKHEYKSWEASEAEESNSTRPELEQLDLHGRALWIHGKPGSGKSFLSVSVIDRLRAFTHRDKQRVVLFFHFDADDRTSNNATSAYRSLLSQVFQKYYNTPDMLDRFSFSMADSHGQKTASAFEVAELLHLCISTLEDKCFIVLDGIDECDDDGRFISGLLTIICNCSSTKLLVFSRPTVAALNDHIPQSLQIPMAYENQCDIQHYLERRIESFIDRGYIPASADKARLLQHLTIGANGMFLWAFLIMKYLDTDVIDQESRVSAIYDITMPDNLDKMYSRILQRIQESNSAERDWAVKVFSWLIYAATPGPFAPEELQACLNPTAGRLDPARFVQTIVRVCGSLVELDTIGHFQFIHISVKEYLVTKPNGFRQPVHRVHAILAAIYLEHLTTHFPAEPLAEKLCEPWKLRYAHPLTYTAVSNLMYHCVQALLCVLERYPPLSQESVIVDVSIVRDLMEIFIPQLRKFLDTQSYLLVWIEISCLLRIPIRSSLVYEDSLRKLSVCLTNHTGSAHVDTISRASADLMDLLSIATEIERDWGTQLRDDSSVLWREVVAFHRLRAGPREAQVMKVTSLLSDRPETSGIGCENLKTISRVRNDGKAMMVLSVWPSKCFEDAAVHRGAELRSRNLWSACSGWLAKYEVWTTEEEPVRVFSVVTKLNAKEILIQCKQSAWEDRSSFPVSKLLPGSIWSPWKFQFPLEISPSGRYFCVLRTVYEVVHPATEDCQPRVRKSKLNMDFDKSEDWDPYRIFEHNMLSPRLLYFPSFTANEDLFVLFARPGAPLGLALFQSSVDEVFQLTLQSSDQSDIYLSLEDAHSITICHNTAVTLIGFIAGPGAYVWDWARTEQPRTFCCFESVIDEPEKIAFSSCGRFLVLRLHANARPIVKDMEQLRGTKRPQELQVTHNNTIKKSLDTMQRMEYSSFLQRTSQYGVVDSTDTSLCIENGVTASNVLHVVSSKSKILVRNIQEDEETEENIINEVELVKLPRSVADDNLIPEATVIIPDAADNSVKVAISHKPPLFSNLSARNNKMLILVQREKASLRLQTTRETIPIKSLPSRTAGNDSLS